MENPTRFLGITVLTPFFWNEGVEYSWLAVLLWPPPGEPHCQ